MQTMSFCSGGSAAVNFASPRGHSAGQRQAQSFAGVHPDSRPDPSRYAPSLGLLQHASLICLRRFLDVLGVCVAACTAAVWKLLPPLQQLEPGGRSASFALSALFTTGKRGCSRQRAASKTHRGRSSKGNFCFGFEERTGGGKASLNDAVCWSEGGCCSAEPCRCPFWELGTRLQRPARSRAALLRSCEVVQDFSAVLMVDPRASGPPRGRWL